MKHVANKGTICMGIARRFDIALCLSFRFRDLRGPVKSSRKAAVKPGGSCANVKFHLASTMFHLCSSSGQLWVVLYGHVWGTWS